MKEHNFDSPPASGKVLHDVSPHPNKEEVCLSQAGPLQTDTQGARVPSLGLGGALFCLNQLKFISENCAQPHTTFFLALARVCLGLASGGQGDGRQRWGRTFFSPASSEHG